ncbi:SURP and G-patch domain-containing protein 1-like [Antedon mediterranea]|uniref:SURP and G-patch domain-containing protein 1-like n=1 Tax=Antedon mediterranea TaxID=105859 RepID=UPI003AF56976
MAYRANRGRGGFQSNKLQTINQQEKMLAAKKKEILLKLEEKKKKKLAEEEAKLASLATSSIPLPVLPAAPAPSLKKNETPSPSKPQSQPPSQPPSAGQNTFSNDGSFLEQFRKMQEAAANKEEKSLISIANTNPPPPPPPLDLRVEPPAPLPVTHYPPPPIPNTYIKSAAPVAPPSMMFSKPAVFQDSDSDEEQDSSGKILPPEDPDLRKLIETFAKSVAEGGTVIEDIATKNHRGNPKYRFLTDTSCKLHDYYRQKVGEYRIKKQQVFADKTVAWLANKDNPSSSQPSNDDSFQGKRKRKSRWGETNSDITPPKIAVGTLSVASVMNPVGMVGTSELSDEQKKQFIEQKQMQAMYDAVISRQKELMQQQQHHEELKRQYEYDSDEDTEGGTWEHKLRSKEMKKTQEYAEKLTTFGRGKHHLGDFLPPEELNKFMETLNSLKEGRTPDYSDYKEFKLQADNIGFQMLQKLGWKDGEGLGSEAQGITAPVNRAAQRSDNQGLGIERPADLTKEDADNEYDAYRKRMMLAYRFRPNPLNNPRRPYY